MPGKATLRLWRQRLTEVRQWHTERKAGFKPRRASAANPGSATARALSQVVVAEPAVHLCGDTREMLNQLKQQYGLSYRAIAAASAADEASPRVLTCSTVHEVLTGRRPVTSSFVESYLEAVGATTAQRHLVLSQFDEDTSVRRAKAVLETARIIGIGSVRSSLESYKLGSYEPPAEDDVELPAATTMDPHLAEPTLVNPDTGPRLNTTRPHTRGTHTPALGEKPSPGRHRAQIPAKVWPKALAAVLMRFSLVGRNLAHSTRTSQG